MSVRVRAVQFPTWLVDSPWLGEGVEHPLEAIHGGFGSTGSGLGALGRRFGPRRGILRAPPHIGALGSCRG